MKSASTNRVVLGHSLDLGVVAALGKLCEALGIQLAACRVQLGAHIARQLSAEGVDGDVECAAIGLELIGEIGY